MKGCLYEGLIVSRAACMKSYLSKGLSVRRAVCMQGSAVKIYLKQVVVSKDHIYKYVHGGFSSLIITQCTYTLHRISII